MTKHLNIALVCLAGLTLSAQAAVIVVPVSHDANTPALEDSLGFANTYDGAGLSFSLSTNDTVPAVLPTYDQFSGGTSGGNGDGTLGRWDDRDTGAGDNDDDVVEHNPQVTYSLGGAFDLDGMIFWNYAEFFDGVQSNDRGLTQATIQVSTDGSIFTDVLTGQAFTLAPTSGSTVTSFAPETFSWTAVENVTHVRITDVAGGGRFLGFNEIAFTAVPEPSTYALLAGMLTFGLVMLRRRRS